MAYRALGWTVWKGLRLYLRRRYGGVVTKRRALVALVAGGAALAGARAVRA